MLVEIISKGIHRHEADTALSTPERLPEGKSISEEIRRTTLPFYTRPVIAKPLHDEPFCKLIVGIDIPAVFKPADPLRKGINIGGYPLIQLNGRSQRKFRKERE